MRTPNAGRGSSRNCLEYRAVRPARWIDVTGADRPSNCCPDFRLFLQPGDFRSGRIEESFISECTDSMRRGLKPQATTRRP